MMKWFENKGITYKEIQIKLPNEVKVYTKEQYNYNNNQYL